MNPSDGESYTPFEVFRIVSLYIFISITMILINKAVLNEVALPLTFLFFQLCIAVVLLHIASFFGFYKLPPLSWKIIRSCGPLVGINVFGLAFNTLCLNFIDAVLFQVARSLVLPMTVVLAPFIEKKSNSWKIVFSCAIIFIGFVIGMFGEREVIVSPQGILFGVLSSVTSALHPFIIKQSYSSIKNDAMDLVYYNNLLSSALIFPLLFLEYSSIWTFIQSDRTQLLIFVFGTLLSGISGLLINVVGFLQIKITSPLTHTISTTSRGAIQSIAAYFILGEVLTIRRCFGITISLVGSTLYSYFKYLEVKPVLTTQQEMMEVVEDTQSQELPVNQKQVGSD